jgi:hypothetical protein
MKLTALIWRIGAACVLLAGCQQASTQSLRPTAVPAVAQTCDRTSSGSTFVAAKVFKLSAAFDPTPLLPPSPQDIMGNVVPTDPYWQDFVDAFTAANVVFKDQLCSLDGVFVVQSTCDQPTCQADDVIDHSWGFRQKISQPKRYIATSATLWQNGTAPSFNAYENMRLQAMMQKLDRTNGDNWFKLSSLRPQFQPASPNSTAMTLLAILAHEYGHVYWYDKFVSPPGGPFKPNASGFCPPKGFYTANSWGNGNSSINVPSTRWITFGQRLPTQVHNPDLSGKLLAYLSQGNFGSAGIALSDILVNAGLSGVLASFSPIEDFVETYEWLQLISANPPLTDLPVQIGNLPSFNVVRWIASKQEVKRKMACFPTT